MSQPLTVANRIDIDYVVAGVKHTARFYFTLVNYLGGNYVEDREATIPTVLWNDAAQFVWHDMASYIFPNTIASVDISRWTRSGAIWSMDEIMAYAFGGRSTSVSTLATELTTVLRDTAGYKLRQPWLEHVIGNLMHSQNGVDLYGGSYENLVKGFNGVNTSGAAPYRWMKSRNNRHLAAAGTIAGVTNTYNRKMRRRRGLT
jgi:hypothetical protein